MNRICEKRIGLVERLRTSGWSPAEDDLLLDAVRQNKESGRSLRSAFAAVADQTGRKADSVRNRFYLLAKESPDMLLRSRPELVRFTEEEVSMLLREMLTGKARGESVRSIALRLGAGDKARMLRFQNKYRAIIKNDPGRIRDTLSELRAEGIACADPYENRTGNAKEEETSGAERALGILSSLDKHELDRLIGYLSDMSDNTGMRIGKC